MSNFLKGEKGKPTQIAVAEAFNATRTSSTGQAQDRAQTTGIGQSQSKCLSLSYFFYLLFFSYVKELRWMDGWY